MTMYGAPLSSVPTSITRATCSLLMLDGGARLADEAGHGLGVARAPRAAGT